jgi:hypothetical protein
MTRNDHRRSRSRASNSDPSRHRYRDKLRDQWSVRRFRAGTLTGPAYIEFKFPTEGGGISRLCVPNSELRHINKLLDEFANLLPVFPTGVAATDAGQKKFIQELVSTDVPLDLVPISTGFIDQNTFVTHGEIVSAAGSRTPRSRIDTQDSRTFVDVKGTAEGARSSVLTLARQSTYLAFLIGVELAACLPRYVRLQENEDGNGEALISETAVFNLSGNSSSGKSSAGLAAISLAGSPERAGSLDFSRRGLAELASDSNDLAFLMDDTEKAEDSPNALVRSLKSVVHMVPAGRSKIISRGVDQLRFPQLHWCSFGLTSSPRPISKLAAENHWQMTPGDKVRLFDIPVPDPERGGIFDRVSGGSDRRRKRSIKLISKLQRGYMNHHGHTVPEWVHYLMVQNRSGRVCELVKRFIDRVAANADGWEVRFATKFALVYAAMKMGTEAKILPWPRRLALKAATKCYRKARAEATQEPIYKPTRAATILCDHLQKLGSIVDRDSKKPTEITDRTIAIRYEKHGRTILGVLDAPLLKLLGSKKAKKRLASVLEDAGVLDRGQGHAGTTQERISTIRDGNEVSKRTRLWVLDARKLKQFARKVRHEA